MLSSTTDTRARSAHAASDTWGPVVRSTYRFLSYAIAVLVVVQAGAIAWAVFGLTNAIAQDGLVINKAYLECTDCESFGAAEWGFAIHMFLNGIVLIPLVSLVRWRSARARPSRSPSSPRTQDSGWTTATTCRTLRRAWSPT